MPENDVLRLLAILVIALVSMAAFKVFLDGVFEIWRQRLRIERIKIEIDLAMRDPELFNRIVEEEIDTKDRPEGG